MMEERCCPYCGKVLQENAQFCPFCMRTLTEKKIVTPRKFRNKKKILIGSILAVLVVIGAVSLYFMTRPHVHTWEPIEESVYHEPQAYADMVITGYRDVVHHYCYYEPDKYIAVFSMEGMESHMWDNHQNEPDFEWVMENLDDLTVKEEGQMPDYGYVPFEQEGYYETVITGYRCTECGQIKTDVES